MSDSVSNIALHYRHKDKTKADVVKAIREYPGLSAKQEGFVYTDGRRMDLVNLQGTIPVSYKSSTYHIPICIWLMDTHPDNAPMCYVKPTPNMRINISHHVDYCGKIYAPYLHDWAPNKSDVITLIQVLIMLFSEHPPLFTLPTNTSTPSTSAPYPTQPSPYYMPMPSVMPTPSYQRPQNTPPYPVQQQQQQQQSVSTPYPIRPSHPTPYPPYPSTNNSMTPSATGTITEQHIHASLLSAAEDKVRRHVNEHLAQSKAELDTLERIQVELVQGKERLGHLMEKLESEQSEWEKILVNLRDKESELDVALSNLSHQADIDVDEAVVTTAPLYKQLLNAFAEEAATEDAIYYLGEGLRRGVIDLDVFLKHVRSLSRKQFMLRALMHKCRNKAGLAC